MAEIISKERTIIQTNSITDDHFVVGIDMVAGYKQPLIARKTKSNGNFTDWRLGHAFSHYQPDHDGKRFYSLALLAEYFIGKINGELRCFDNEVDAFEWLAKAMK